MSNEYPVVIVQFLPIIDTVTTNNKVGTVVDILEFIETLEYIPHRTLIEINDFLNITQRLTKSGAKHHFTISQTLHLSDRVIKVNVIHLKDKLIFTQDSERVHKESQTLTFTDYFTVSNGIILSDFLEFAQTVIDNHRWSNILLSNEILFSDRGIAHKLPKIGKAYDQIYVPEAPITRKTNISLLYNNLIVTLRNPSFGNTYKYNFNRQQLESRGKNLIIAANSTYQFQRSVNMVSFTIEYLKQKDRLNLYTFFNQIIGQPIVMIDHEDVHHMVLITTPELEFTQQDLNNYSTSFDMEVLD